MVIEQSKVKNPQGGEEVYFLEERMINPQKTIGIFFSSIFSLIPV